MKFETMEGHNKSVDGFKQSAIANPNHTRMPVAEKDTENTHLYPIPTAPLPSLPPPEQQEQEPFPQSHASYPVVQYDVQPSPLVLHSFAPRDIKRAKRYFFYGLVLLVLSLLVFWTALPSTLLWIVALAVNMINYFKHRTHADPSVRIWAARSGMLLLVMLVVALVQIVLVILIVVLTTAD